MPRLRLRAKPHKATLPTSFPTFAEIEERNEFQALDLELWPTRGDLDAPLTGFSCSARQWLASTPGKAWVRRVSQGLRRAAGDCQGGAAARRQWGGRP